MFTKQVWKASCQTPRRSSDASPPCNCCISVGCVELGRKVLSGATAQSSGRRRVRTGLLESFLAERLELTLDVCVRPHPGARSCLRYTDRASHGGINAGVRTQFGQTELNQLEALPGMCLDRGGIFQQDLLGRLGPALAAGPPRQHDCRLTKSTGPGLVAQAGSRTLFQVSVPLGN
jgi:hypothetical protein